MKYFNLTLILMTMILLFDACGIINYEEELKSFINEHLKVVKPLSKNLALASWNATATGEKKYYTEMEDLELKLRKVYSNKEDFDKLKNIKEKGNIQDPLLKRELELLYNSYLSNQMDTVLMKEIVRLNTEIQNNFNTYRAKINGKEVSDNEILEILKNEKNSDVRKTAWEASKQVGKIVEQDLLKIIKLRNQIATKLGFKNFYEMSMILDEQKVEEIIPIFDRLKEKTDEPFKELKNKIDNGISKKLGVKPEDLKPWHYEDPFFQKVPQVSVIDFDKFYKGKNIQKLGEDFYKDIDMPVDDIIKNSDLYEKPGKYPHAFCSDIDREGDIRVMLNIKDNEEWMETMLHELGHAVYDKYIDKGLPYILRTAAHTFTTEAIAQLMERQAKNPSWMKEMINISDKEKEEIGKVIKEQAKMKALVFCRWSLVMVNFEKAMYENPDQDLNKLWWDMVEKYQFIKRPENRNEPDYAAKIHLAQYPVYYHNYQLGELLSSQLMNYIAKNIEKTDDISGISFNKKKAIGNYLKEKVFNPGAKYYWNDMIKNATGDYLNPDYYINEYIEKK
jgi:peptidyl-dipeptidase A